MKTIRMMTLAAASLAMIGFYGAGVAQAQMQTQTQTQTQDRISWSELTRKLEAKGYYIRELDMKVDGWEAEVTDQNHRRLDLRINRMGEIVREKLDD